MSAERGDEGFGIVEALVAILLFGLLALALVPPLVLSIQTSANTTTIATATEVANDRIEQARAASGSCEELLDFLRAEIPDDYGDARGIDFEVIQSPSPAEASEASFGSNFCDASPADTVPFSVEVSAGALDSPDVASAQTIIAVPGLGR